MCSLSRILMGVGESIRTLYRGSESGCHALSVSVLSVSEPHRVWWWLVSRAVHGARSATELFCSVCVLRCAGCAWDGEQSRTVSIGTGASRLESGSCVAGVAGWAEQQNHSRNEQKRAVLAFCGKSRTRYRQTENANRTKIRRVYVRLLF